MRTFLALALLALFTNLSYAGCGPSAVADHKLGTFFKTDKEKSIKIDNNQQYFKSIIYRPYILGFKTKEVYYKTENGILTYTNGFFSYDKCNEVSKFLVKSYGNPDHLHKIKNDKFMFYRGNKINLELILREDKGCSLIYSLN